MRKSLSCFVTLFLCIVQCSLGQIQDLDFVYFDYKQLGINTQLTSVAEDDEGRIWAGSVGSGICIYNGHSFDYLQSNSGDSLGLPSNRILGLLKLQNGDMLIGTDHGVSTYSSKNNEINNLKIQHSAFTQWNHFSESLAEDSLQNIWIGSANGLIKYDPSTFQTDLYKADTELGAHKDRNVNFFIRILQDPSDENIIWCGSQYGLRTFNKRNETFTEQNHPPKWHNRSPSFKKYGTFDLAFSSPKLLWMSAWQSGGILSYQTETNSWTQYLYKGGIQSQPYHKNDVLCVLPLNDTSVVFGARHFLGVTNYRSKELDYIPVLDSSQTGFVREANVDRNGILWLACQKALVRSTSPIVRQDIYPAQPVLTSVKANGEIIDLNEINLDFESDVNELIFETTLINPMSPDQVEYRWKLNGYDRNWRNLGNRRSDIYSNVSGGKYTFEFESKVPNGEWQKGNPIQIKIDQPFYLKTYFFALLAAILGMVIFAIIRITAHITRREEMVKNSYERKLIEAELTALRAQMNPHFIFNSLNSIYNFILNNDTENAAEYLVKFSKLMRMVLAHSKKKLIPLSEELNVINLYLELERIRFNEKFNYIINVDEELNLQQIQLPPMLVQPFLENAIWHGLMHKKSGGTIHLSLSGNSSKDVLLITVIDDGIGRKKSKELNRTKKKKSFGMDITQKRMDSFETMFGRQAKLNIIDLIDPSGEASGTEVRLEIPYTHQNKKNESIDHRR